MSSQNPVSSNQFRVPSSFLIDFNTNNLLSQLPPEYEWLKLINNFGKMRKIKQTKEDCLLQKWISLSLHNRNYKFLVSDFNEVYLVKKILNERKNFIEKLKNHEGLNSEKVKNMMSQAIDKIIQVKIELNDLVGEKQREFYLKKANPISKFDTFYSINTEKTFLSSDKERVLQKPIRNTINSKKRKFSSVLKTYVQNIQLNKLQTADSLHQGFFKPSQFKKKDSILENQTKSFHVTQEKKNNTKKTQFFYFDQNKKEDFEISSLAKTFSTKTKKDKKIDPRLNISKSSLKNSVQEKVHKQKIELQNLPKQQAKRPINRSFLKSRTGKKKIQEITTFKKADFSLQKEKQKEKEKNEAQKAMIRLKKSKMKKKNEIKKNKPSDQKITKKSKRKKKAEKQLKENNKKFEDENFEQNTLLNIEINDESIDDQSEIYSHFHRTYTESELNKIVLNMNSNVYKDQQIIQKKKKVEVLDKSQKFKKKRKQYSFVGNKNLKKRKVSSIMQFFDDKEASENLNLNSNFTQIEKKQKPEKKKERKSVRTNLIKRVEQQDTEEDKPQEIDVGRIIKKTSKKKRRVIMLPGKMFINKTVKLQEMGKLANEFQTGLKEFNINKDSFVNLEENEKKKKEENWQYELKKPLETVYENTISEKEKNLKLEECDRFFDILKRLKEEKHHLYQTDGCTRNFQIPYN